jgi:phospholipid/cholesterol/gamma-HCH transport system substrate-binding protein
MSSKIINNARLGIFVSAGLLILIISLYTVGKNHSLFGERFHLRARFRDANGLMAGNNVRYAGIQAGTVAQVEMVNDTTIEVYLLIDKKMKAHIHTNACAAIGSEGLMGNKVVNIFPGDGHAPEVDDNTLLNTKKNGDTDDMIATLSATNDNLLMISEDLKTTLARVNNSKAIWNIMNDTTLGENIRASLINVKNASANVNEFSAVINKLAKGIDNGDGVAGLLLKNEHAAANMQSTLANISKVATNANKLIVSSDSMIHQIQHDIDAGAGIAHVIFNDTAAKSSLTSSLKNIQTGTASFNESMEALKHNFLTRRYFKKKARQKK